MTDRLCRQSSSMTGRRVDDDTSADATVDEVPAISVHRAVERFRCCLCERDAPFIIVYVDRDGHTRKPATCRSHVGLLVSAHL